MEQGRESQEIDEKERLKSLRRDIADKKEEEMEKKTMSKGESYDPHFDHINPEYLERSDLIAYRDLELMDRGTFLALQRERLGAFPRKEKAEEYETILDFWAYMANQLSAYIEMRREMQRKNPDST